ncbi:MAG: AAA family ATPase, partial [Flavobacteriaceae bacterium]
MHLTSLALVNFKNFEAQSFEFDAKINCFVGPNGVGKTNVLDAIYQLSFGKSYFNPIALQNIKHGEDFLVIDGNYQKNDVSEHVVLGIKKGQK